jgi:DNA repair protein RecN (Recombination protein N)
MLRELHISNLAVIEEAHLHFHEGLNCFTGETGAGKSLVLGAFEILLGLRSGTDYLRTGADEGRVSGLFELGDPAVRAAAADVLDLTLDDGEPLLLTRKLFASGRTSVSANGQPVTAAMVRAVGELLVDVHGQHDHQYLLKPANQLAILDAFADADEPRQRFAELFDKLRMVRQRRDELAASSKLRRQQRELYEFQAHEIDAADLASGEFDAVRDRHRKLSNLQRIRRDAEQVQAALYESEGSVGERLAAVSHVLRDLTELDGELGSAADSVRTAASMLQDASFELARYVDRLELDGGELAQVEARLDQLHRLIARYGHEVPGGGDDPIAAVLAYREQIERELRQLRGDDSDAGGIDRQIAALEVELTAVGRQLTDLRRTAAERLRPLVEAQLAELGMAEAAFEVQFHTTAPEQAESPTGLDQIEMLVRTNPGQPARPLRKIASGGELSRIMLAVKSILADSDRISVLVFDEIDANIGGRMGTVIGRKLRALTRPDGRHADSARSRRKAGNASGGAHQVLCITHLPQIAAFADCHLRIAKQVVGKGKTRQTRTAVAALQGAERIDELAAMLAGQSATDTSRKQARELIDAAM